MLPTGDSYASPGRFPRPKPSCNLLSIIERNSRRQLASQNSPPQDAETGEPLCEARADGGCEPLRGQRETRAASSPQSGARHAAPSARPTAHPSEPRQRSEAYPARQHARTPASCTSRQRPSPAAEPPRQRMRRNTKPRPKRCAYSHGETGNPARMRGCRSSAGGHCLHSPQE